MAQAAEIRALTLTGTQAEQSLLRQRLSAQRPTKSLLHAVRDPLSSEENAQGLVQTSAPAVATQPGGLHAGLLVIAAGSALGVLMALVGIQKRPEISP